LSFSQSLLVEPLYIRGYGFDIFNSRGRVESTHQSVVEAEETVAEQRWYGCHQSRTTRVLQWLVEVAEALSSKILALISMAEGRWSQLEVGSGIKGGEVEKEWRRIER
jgi:hypothetical protein